MVTYSRRIFEGDALQVTITSEFDQDSKVSLQLLVNLFILTQEPAVFDDANKQEKIKPRLLRKNAQEDMKIIQPVLHAIRKNDLRAM